MTLVGVDQGASTSAAAAPPDRLAGVAGGDSERRFRLRSTSCDGEREERRIELAELVILGAHEKLARLRAERDDAVARRRQLADRVRLADPPSKPARSPRACRFCSKPATRPVRDHAQLPAELLSLPRLPIDELVEQRAVDAQRQLARVRRLTCWSPPSPTAAA